MFYSHAAKAKNVGKLNRITHVQLSVFRRYNVSRRISQSRTQAFYTLNLWMLSSCLSHISSFKMELLLESDPYYKVIAMHSGFFYYLTSTNYSGPNITSFTNTCVRANGILTRSIQMTRWLLSAFIDVDIYKKLLQ